MIYVGYATTDKDTDPDDMIYVRAPTRIGPKYQVAVKDKPQGRSGRLFIFRFLEAYYFQNTRMMYLYAEKIPQSNY